MMNQVLALWNTVLNVALYPSTWAHEQTHYLALRPYVEGVEREYGPTRSGARVELDVSSRVPVWRAVVGALAPTLLGLLCALGAVVVSTSIYPLSVGEHALEWLLVGAYWFTYTQPSTADLHAALAAATTNPGDEPTGGGGA